MIACQREEKQLNGPLAVLGNAFPLLVHLTELEGCEGLVCLHRPFVPFRGLIEVSGYAVPLAIARRQVHHPSVASGFSGAQVQPKAFGHVLGHSLAKEVPVPQFHQRLTVTRVGPGDELWHLRFKSYLLVLRLESLGERASVTPVLVRYVILLWIKDDESVEPSYGRQQVEEAAGFTP
jgi:hypothetical protein